MVKMFIRNAVWYALCTATLIDGKIGCMAIDKPVGKFDNKTYHFVQCNCHCQNVVTDTRNYCLDCGHWHDPKPWAVLDEKEIARAVQAAKKQKKERPSFRSPGIAFKQLVAKYRAK